ncbi:MAG TPA: 3-oxoacyl-[acyl-carrier-protein] synthase III C-terminal domain-containing protein [Candidatus Polarisedimenticolaceae bacterium]|nr:3-oxoacyl-[acyl-carrier-protein] synthase III C-terminal domain-containing protein [Candidatus Polarisedimenticolaceae bacterium]
MRAVLKGTGMFVPELVVDNHRLSRIMDTSDEWIQQRTGIVTRHYAGPHQATSDLAVPAAAQAVAEAGLERDQIDYVVFATMTPDYYFPGAGPVFARKFGLAGVPCLDIRQQCAGFVWGLQLADAVIRAGQYRNVLLIGAEVHAGFMPWDWDLLFGKSRREPTASEYEWNTRFRDRTVLFGDGAGAFVLSAVDDDETEAGIEAVTVHSDGVHWDKMWVDGVGSAYRPWIDRRMIESGAVVPIVQGRDVFKVAVTLMPDVTQKILAQHGYTLDDLRLVIMHQANLRINEACQKRLGLPDERVFNNIQRYGNTTAATLPIAFHEARRERGLEAGDLVAFVALGSGLNWGAALYRC